MITYRVSNVVDGQSREVASCRDHVLWTVSQLGDDCMVMQSKDMNDSCKGCLEQAGKEG